VPNRIIKESCRTSPTLNTVSAEAERLWWRLVTVADDHGRFNADPDVLAPACFPRQVSQGIFASTQISAWLGELVKVDGVRLYTVDRKRYGYFVGWRAHQRPPRSQAKFPDPPKRSSRAVRRARQQMRSIVASRGQLTADVDSRSHKPAVADNCGPRIESRESRVVNREARTEPDPQLSTPRTGLEPVTAIARRVVG